MTHCSAADFVREVYSALPELPYFSMALDYCELIKCWRRGRHHIFLDLPVVDFPQVTECLSHHGHNRIVHMKRNEAVKLSHNKSRVLPIILIDTQRAKCEQ